MSTPSGAVDHNPAAPFYGGLVACGLGLALRVSQSIAPRAATWLALRLFFTPLPLKLAARRRAWPADWRMEQWAFERGTLAVYRRSRADAGIGRPTVLLVHGWAGDAQQMLPLAEALDAAGVEPVILDLPAHGRSSGWRSTLPQFVRAIWAASARLGPLHGVVAHSLGALAGAHAAANGLPVQRLALLGTSPAPALFLEWFARNMKLGEGLSQRMVHRMERVEGVPLACFESAWLGPRLHQPTLIVHDENDRVSPLAVGQGLAQATRVARLRVTRSLGHRRVLADSTVAQEVADHMRPNGSQM